MTVAFGLGTRLHVRKRTTLENGVLRNRQQPGRAENSFIDRDEFVVTSVDAKHHGASLSERWNVIWVGNNSIYRSVPLIRPPILYTTSSLKWGEGLYSNIKK